MQSPSTIPRSPRRILAALLTAAALAACARSPEPPAPESLAATGEWQRIEKAKRALDELRARLPEREKTAPSDAARAALARDAERRADELARRLVAFLNASPPREGEPLTPLQQRAIRMKSGEDVLVARGYVERAGDYRRAIEILEAALSLEPASRELRAEIERTRAARFVTAARFAQVKDGMKSDEVAALLGAPNPHNVRSYPDKGVLGWFYPKDESGAAAAVWLERKGGDLVVYRADFAAIEPGGVEAEVPGSPPPARDGSNP